MPPARRPLVIGAILFLAAARAGASVANDAQLLVAAHQLPLAAQEVKAAQAKLGPNPEIAAALSWLARGALDEKQLAQADAYATEARNMALHVLGIRNLDSDPWLPTALGAAIEVHGQVLAAHGQRAAALAYLRQELNSWGHTSLNERIRKNINLLSLEGRPAPPLEGFNLASLKGRPVILFFWAHWCPDCKADAPIIAAVRQRYASQGLTVVGPTRLYGYAAGGDPATPAAEKQYIEQIRQHYYSALTGMPTPVSAANFEVYGASTTPTLVLLDRAGIVRLYHPGAMSEQELASRVQALLR
ncbi:MAG TPA: TlpA disulfide reductase family protein [Bryobacteraceae bacterium]|nr:TlpA disulfide reductase family protein [Bryobacteraceae bacterium]